MMYSSGRVSHLTCYYTAKVALMKVVCDSLVCVSVVTRWQSSFSYCSDVMMIPCQPVDDAALTTSHVERGYIFVKLMVSLVILFVDCIKVIGHGSHFNVKIVSTIWHYFNNLRYTTSLLNFFLHI